MGIIRTDPALANQTWVFHDRDDAGRTVARLLREHISPRLLERAVVLAIPAGGVPVGLAIAEELGLPFDLIFIRKLHFPDNPEAGFGAVTEHGEVLLNEPLSRQLSSAVIRRQVEIEKRALARRVAELRRLRPEVPLTGRVAIIADDGLASGFTMLAAVREARRRGAREVIVAVPTASEQAARRVAREAEAVIVANLRGGPYFAVAEAYTGWRDLSLEEVARMLARAAAPNGV
jgi:predicted phosphoribosyltransferase